MKDSKGKRKVAILGGGVGAMTTAFALTDPNNPNHKNYDITVYQIGWRIGGKGASGRNMDSDKGYRIEEHGLHVWFGCYDNAFRIMQQAYGELDRPPDSPLATWRDAFKPHSFAVLTQRFKEKWYFRPGAFPTNNIVPGEGGLLPLWDYIIIMIKWLRISLKSTKYADLNQDISGDDDIRFPGLPERKWDRLVSKFEDRTLNCFLRMVHTFHLLPFIGNIIERFLLWVFRLFVKRHWRKVKKSVQNNPHDNWSWTLVNFCYATFNGIVREKLFSRGLNAANGRDYREWVGDYAIPDGDILINSTWITGIYDGMFAYEDGDNSIPPNHHYPPKSNMEAGVALRTGLRQFLTYKGAAVWKMQASMAEVVFTPLYEVLKQRGVKFKFFHQVKHLKPSEDGRTIEEITIAEQIKVKPEQESKGGYEPIFDVKGISCWPSTPFYDQLVNGEDLKKSGANLEDPFSPWEPAEQKVLRIHEDFDDVVLGISLGGLPYICSDLVKMSNKWQNMLQHMKTTRTMGGQLWLNKTAFELGWTMMRQPLTSGYESTPMDTWADMSHLIDKESWSAGQYPDTDQSFPKNIGYYCGVMVDEPLQEQSPDGFIDKQHMSPTEGTKFVRGVMLDYLKTKIALFFPKALNPEGQVRWELLVDAKANNKGEENRLDSQYYRANTFPSERYVLSVAGSNQYRLPAHDSEEFTNLYLAGDWTDHNMNVGCVESAVMSALLASNALSSYPEKENIIGLKW
jgi:uncharacterized protein with NAD-binding domain and iron-sulfur cluster